MKRNEKATYGLCSSKKLFANGDSTISELAVTRLRNRSNSRFLNSVSSWDVLPAVVKVISASGSPGITSAGNAFFRSLRKSTNSLNLLSTVSVCPPIVCGIAELIYGAERKWSEKGGGKPFRSSRPRRIALGNFQRWQGETQWRRRCTFLAHLNSAENLC